MKFLLKLAWRNVWRNKRRTILTIFAITFATFFTIFQRGLAVGIWEYNLTNTLELFSGYLQIQRTGYNNNPSLSLSFPYDRALQEHLEHTRGITGYAPRILSEGLISFRDNSSGAAIFGIDPEAENSTSRLMRRLDAGRFFEARSPDEVVLGRKLLQSMNAQIGDTLVILAQGYDGVLGNLLFRIVGTAKLGIPAFDAMAVFMDITAAEELLAMHGRVNVVAINVENVKRISQTQQELEQGLMAAGVTDLSVLPWEEVMPELKQAREFDQIGDWFFLGILIIIVTFGILNTVLMAVTERFREIGVTLAVGMPPLKLVVLVFLETAFIALIAILIGNIIGYGLNSYIAANPIVLGGEFAEIYAEYGFLPQIVASTDVTILINVSILILVISVIACFYPAYKVSKLEPLKGIRYT